MRYFPTDTSSMDVNMFDDINDDVDISDELADTSDLPTSVIITNVDTNIFMEQNQKDQFEEIFQVFDDKASFQYFKSFRRVRVNFTNPDAAANARIQCHERKIGDCIVNCYFAQPILPNTKEGEGSSSDAHLQPPSPVRQFLISPPASPPVGWEPVGEAQPCINYDLLAALAKLTPGEAHELHPPSITQPGIVVHVCEDRVTDGRRIKMVQTRRPDSMDSSSGGSSPPSPTI
ncbi:hypothetical protein JTE90_027447 [Oedothorax gibbosus]|uniref:Uncharacterized protein n=1 Tax=Oedothorax gibbosus TaxID=931172 RepID=A0AAV6VZ63_9ARAC|nr:hypothetical protein JTE90_027447 [Oedothorax gibbosus]